MSETAPQWHHGRIIWREHTSQRCDEAKAFYTELFGWKFEEAPMPGFVYLMAAVNGQLVAGVMAMPDTPPYWMSYVSVADVDAAADAVKANGGTVVHGPADIPEVGRFAVIGDPSGAMITAFCPTAPDGTPDHRPGPGEFCWETLNSADPSAIGPFYNAVFGWDLKTEGMPVFHSGDTQVADVQQNQPGMPSFWLPHVVVADLVDRRDAAQRLGAVVLEPEITVPGVGRLALIQDPAGALISLFEFAGA